MAWGLLRVRIEVEGGAAAQARSPRARRTPQNPEIAATWSWAGDHHRLAAHPGRPASPLTTANPSQRARRETRARGTPAARSVPGLLSYPGTKIWPRNTTPRGPAAVINSDERSRLGHRRLIAAFPIPSIFRRHSSQRASRQGAGRVVEDLLVRASGAVIAPRI